MEKKNVKQELEYKIITRALKDTEFREKLLQDPKGAIQQELGLTVPASISVRVIEEKENEVWLVLPTAEQEEGELREVDFEMVAGGGWSVDTECGSCNESCDTKCYRCPI